MIKYLLDTSGCLSREQHLIKVNYPSSEYQQTSIENLETVLEGLDYYPTPVGSIEFVRKYLEIVGRVEPAPLNYLRYKNTTFTLPSNFMNLVSDSIFSEFIESYEKRNIWLTSYDSEIFHILNEEQKLFIKPYKLKEFDPVIIDIGQQPSEEIQKSEKIFLSDVVDFSSEYRFYVCDKEILGYSIYGEGEPQYVDIRFVEYIISEFKHYTYPVAYSVDIGIDKNGEHYLVELNDGWSLGYYPWGTCSFESYLRVINSRWNQILRGAHTVWS
jgi:hypothetical protein